MRDAPSMRTTVDIDDDALQAARELAQNRKTTLGAVLSELIRRGLQSPRGRTAMLRNGVPVLPRRPRGERKPTMEQVNQLRDDA